MRYDATMVESHVERTYARLRAQTTGELRFDEHVRSVRFVYGPDGRLITPVMVAMLQAFETVLYVPDMSENSIELLVTLYEFDERGTDGSLADRWRIYHGEPEDVRWATLDIETIRADQTVFDGDAITRVNPLAAHEPALCRRLNTIGTAGLQRLCSHYANHDVEAPVVVGVDDSGIDVRRAFDVVRVPTPRVMSDADEAHEVIDAMIHEASGGGAG